MISPFDSSQVLQSSQDVQPAVSYLLVPETQFISMTPYAAEASQALPSVVLPTQTSQMMGSIPQIPQISVSQVSPTISMAPQVSQMVPSISMAPSMSQLPPQPFQVPPQLPKPLKPSPPYEAFVPPTPTPRSVTDNAPPMIYQFYQAVPFPPAQAAQETNTSFANVPVSTSMNVQVSNSMNIPITNSYSSATAPIPVAPSNSLLLGTQQYQTATASSFI